MELGTLSSLNIFILFLLKITLPLSTKMQPQSYFLSTGNVNINAQCIERCFLRLTGFLFTLNKKLMYKNSYLKMFHLT